MDYYISKTAKEESEKGNALRKAVSVVWKEDAGLLENLFPVMLYFVMLWSPLNILHTVLAALGAHTLGLNPRKFGKWMDEQAGTGPGQAPSIDQMGNQLESAFSGLISNAKSADRISSRHITKEAGLWGLIKGIPGLAKMMAGGMKKFITVVLGVFGVMSIEGLLEEAGKMARDVSGLQTVPEMIDQTDSAPTATPDAPETSESPTPKKPKDDLDSMLDSLEEKYNLK